NDRHITAVVLLSGATTGSTLDALRQALDAQTRRPDRVVVVAPSDLPEDARGLLEEDLSAERIHRLLPVSASLSRAGAVRETLEALSAGPGDDTASEAVEVLDGVESAHGSDGPDDAEHAGAEAASAEDGPRRRAGGRRARDVDSAGVARERPQRAEDR